MTPPPQPFMVPLQTHSESDEDSHSCNRQQETQKWAAEWKWKLLNVEDSQLVKTTNYQHPTSIQRYVKEGIPVNV